MITKNQGLDPPNKRCLTLFFRRILLDLQSTSFEMPMIRRDHYFGAWGSQFQEIIWKKLTLHPDN